MKLFLVILSALLFASMAIAHPHHEHGHHHGHGSHSHEHSHSSESGDCDRPKPPSGPEWEQYLRDLRDFVALYPIEEIKEIIGAHLEDEELQATIAFVRSDEFEDIAEQIAASEEVQAVKEYFKNANWPWVKRMVRMAMAQRRNRGGMRADEGNATATGGLDGLIDDIIAVLPKEDLRALFDEKMENSDVFRAVVEIVSSDEVRQLVENVRNSESLRPLFERIEENGIHAAKLKELLLALFGF